MTEEFASSMRDVVVIGGGPSGIAAATMLASKGVKTTLADDQPALGGQIYRSVERVASKDALLFSILGTDYSRGLDLIAAFHRSGAEHLSSTAAWRVDGTDVWVVSDGRSTRLSSRAVILATGAMERPVPIPGWALPGVMSAGGLQILLKSASIVPSGPVVFAGSGPLLYLLTCQCLALGVEVAAVVDTTPRSNFLPSIGHLPKALRGAGVKYLLKGLGLIARIRRSGVPIYKNCGDLSVTGQEKASGLSFSDRRGKRHVGAEHIVLHEGVIPLQHMTRGAGCSQRWDAAQTSFSPNVDEWGAGSAENILVVGDAAGIGGARVAELDGRIAAAEVMHRLGFLSREERDILVKPFFRERASQDSVRPFLDRLYRPASAIFSPPDSAIVCRCECVTAGDVRRVVELGCRGPNQVKSFLRAGMGPCQGRMCGPTVASLIAETLDQPIGSIDVQTVRPPLKPVTIGQLASGADGSKRYDFSV